MNKVSTFLSALILMMIIWVPGQSQQIYRSAGNGPQVDYKVNPIEKSDQRGPLVTFFEEDFESGDFNTNGWTLTDVDGDGNNWYLPTGFTPHTGSLAAGSHSWLSGVILSPDNWMSALVDLSDASGTVLMDFWVRAQDQVWPSEHYGVYASTAGETPDDFLGADGALLYEETVVAGTDDANNLYVKRTIDLSAYAGDLAFIAFRHFDSSDWFAVNIDDILVYESSTVDLGITGVVAPSNQTTCALDGEQDVSVTIFNYGGAPQTGFEVSYTLNGVTVTETVDQVVNPASSIDYNFAQTANFGGLGYYVMDFNVNAEGDIDESNNDFSHNVSNTDANVEVVVASDANSGQSWELISSTGDVIASHGAYQWNITESTNVCVIADDCYQFNWYGGVTNTVSVYYNGELVNMSEATGDFTLYAVGEACAPIAVVYQGHLIQDYGVLGDQSFSGYFLNIGTDPVTSIDVQYSVNGMMSDVETLSGLNVPQGETYIFTHPTPYNFTETGEYDITLSLSNVNGEVTPDPNTFSHTFNILEYAPTTRILGEEATGTWCGFCVRGHVFMDYMDANYPDTWIGVAVHNADPMVVTAYDEGIGAFISGYPSGLVNRYNFGAGYDVDPSDFEMAHNLLINRVVPADVTISAASFNEETRNLTFKVNAIFAGTINKDFNINAIIMENDVRGTTSDWDQVNYYSGGGFGEMGGYENLPDPVPAADMVYQNVARAILGGWYGVTGVIRNVNTEGTYSYTFSYTVPSDVNVDNLFIVGVVSDTESGEIVNASKVSFDYALQLDEVKSIVDFNVFPNPSASEFNIELNLEQSEKMSIYVSDFMGRVVQELVNEQEIIQYHESISLDVNPGVYFVNVKTATGISVQKIVKL